MKYRRLSGDTSPIEPQSQEKTKRLINYYNYIDDSEEEEEEEEKDEEQERVKEDEDEEE